MGFSRLLNLMLIVLAYQYIRAAVIPEDKPGAMTASLAFIDQYAQSYQQEQNVSVTVISSLPFTTSLMLS